MHASFMACETAPVLFKRLSGLFLQIDVRRIRAARKSRFALFRTKRLNYNLDFFASSAN
jgi:hypothetical protein